MSSFLAKRIISFSFFSSSSYHHHQLTLLTPLLYQSFSTQNQQVKKMPFIAQHLISSFGFSPERAIKVSTEKRVAAIKSKDRPEFVVRFLKDTSLSDDQIKVVVSCRSDLLASNVEKSLKLEVRELKDGGFSGELLVHLIQYSPASLLSKNPLSCLLFWRDFVGKYDGALLKMLQEPIYANIFH